MVIQQGVPELKLCSSQNHNERGWRLHYTAPKKVHLRRLQQTNGMKISVQKLWKFFSGRPIHSCIWVCFKNLWRHFEDITVRLFPSPFESTASKILHLGYPTLELPDLATLALCWLWRAAECLYRAEVSAAKLFWDQPGGDPVPLGWVDCRLFVRERLNTLWLCLFLSFNLHAFQSFSRQIMAFLLGRGLLGPCLSNIRLETTRTSCCVDFNIVFERFLDCHH